MITKFDSSYVGSVDLENPGYLGTPINDRRYSNEELADVLHKAVAYAKQMDRLGYDTFWMAEHHFQPEGTECIPNLLMMAMHLARRDQEPQDRLRLQRRADVASAAPGGRLRHGRHPDRRPRHLRRRRAAITRARSRASARRSPTRTANREMFEEGVDVVFKAFNEERFCHKGKYYTIPPEVPYRGYTLKEHHPGAAPAAPAGRMLAADPERLGARLRLHGQARHLAA